MTHKYKAGQTVILDAPKQYQSAYMPELLPYVGKKAFLLSTRTDARYYDHPFWAITIDGKEVSWAWSEAWMRLISCPCNVKNCITNHNKQGE
jgi:hypothetical protein